MRQSPKRWIGPWFTREAVSAALVVTLFLTVYAARKENRRSPRPFAEAVLRRLAEGESRSARALYRSSLPPTVAFYLPLDTGREDTARTILVVGGRSGRAPDVAAAFTAETGQPVSETKAIELEEGSNPDRWTLFELTLANRRGFASAR